MKLDEMLNDVSHQIPTVDDLLKDKIYTQAIMQKAQPKVYSLKNLKLVLMLLFLLIGFSMVIINQKPYERGQFSGFNVIVYAESDSGYQLQELSNLNAKVIGRYTWPMNLVPGIPITLSCDNSYIELSVDHGQFVLDHSCEIVESDHGNAIFKPINGEKIGIEYVGKTYLINGSSTIYWVPVDMGSSIVYTNATITYKIIQEDKVVSTGKIIITKPNDFYKISLKQN